MKKSGVSPLIEKYNDAFNKDQTSRVFAPLAEGYRQAGLLVKAQEILKIGIRNNPAYLQGYISLANCYSDLGEFNLAYTTLRPLVSENRDNIRLQKLFGSVCIELENTEEALESYKYILFISPKDEDAIHCVKELEDSEKKNGPTEYSEVAIAKFEIGPIDVSPETIKPSLDEWVKVDLEVRPKDLHVKEDMAASWKVKRPEAIRPVLLFEKVVAPKVKANSTIEEVRKVDSSPVITHSLVDLYIGQGHLSKARELLGKILELNPNEESSRLKLEEVLALEGKVRLEGVEEDEGHKRLLDSIDKKLGQEVASTSNAVQCLESFLDAIQTHVEGRKSQQI